MGGSDNTSPTKVIDVDSLNEEEAKKVQEKSSTSVNFEEASSLFDNLFEKGSGDLIGSKTTELKQTKTIEEPKLVETPDDVTLETNPTGATEIDLSESDKSSKGVSDSNTEDTLSKTQISVSQGESESPQGDETADYSISEKRPELDLEEEEERFSVGPNQPEKNIPQTQINVELGSLNSEESEGGIDEENSGITLEVKKNKVRDVKLTANKKGDANISREIRSGLTKVQKKSEIQFIEDDATLIAPKESIGISESIDEEDGLISDQGQFNISPLEEGFTDDEMTKVTPFDLNEDDEATVVRSLGNEDEAKTTRIDFNNGPSIHQVHQEVLHYNSDEMAKVNVTIRNLREDRERLLKRIAELEKEKMILNENNLGLRAETDDAKIELSLFKKRYREENQQSDYKTKLAEDKMQLYEEKMKAYKKELEHAGQKLRVDFHKIKEREKELEGQLELLKVDSQAQIQGREAKIIELKRKIDALEYNMENMTLNEQKNNQDKNKMENKMHQVMKTLRETIKILEHDDLDTNPEEILKKLKL